MTAVNFDVICKPRFTLKLACAPFAAQHRPPNILRTMRAQFIFQSRLDPSDGRQFAKDITFHSALVDAADYQAIHYHWLVQ